jgi:hypothetical protein
VPVLLSFADFCVATGTFEANFIVRQVEQLYHVPAMPFASSSSSVRPYLSRKLILLELHFVHGGRAWRKWRATGPPIHVSQLHQRADAHRSARQLSFIGNRSA